MSFPAMLNLLCPSHENLYVFFSLAPKTKEEESIKVYHPRHPLFLIFLLLSRLKTIFQ